MKTKTFDAVAMTREIRDQLSREMEGMTDEESRRYTQKLAEASPLYQRLFGTSDNAAPSSGSKSTE